MNVQAVQSFDTRSSLLRVTGYRISARAAVSKDALLRMPV
jgi:hypothetical protein